MARYLSLLLIALAAAACADRRTDHLDAIEARRAGYEAIKDDLEQPIPTTALRAAGQDLIDTTVAFVRAWPEDTAVPALAYETARVYEVLGDFRHATAWYDSVWTNHPEHRYAPVARYRAAYVAELFLSDLPEAHRRYEGFLEAYPDHPFAKNLEAEMRHLGDPEGLLDEVLRRREETGQTGEEYP